MCDQHSLAQPVVDELAMTLLVAIRYLHGEITYRRWHGYESR
jgi:hypothetical protein